jgi:hypothetical protein
MRKFIIFVEMQLSSRGLAYVATVSIFLGLSYASLFGRLYIRRFVVKKFDLDDLFLVITLVSQTFLPGRLSNTFPGLLYKLLWVYLQYSQLPHLQLWNRSE